jgi:hypothetical protein
MRWTARILVAVVAALSACGGSDQEELYTGEGGSSGAGGGKGGASGSGGSPSGGGAGLGVAGGGGGGSAGHAGQLAGGSAGTPQAGGASGETGTPGSIQCGGTPCSTTNWVCCIGVTKWCSPEITGCPLAKVMVCDDAADCTAGKVCCAHLPPPKYEFTGASCESNCPDEGNVRLCTTDYECRPDRTCKPLASLPGFKGCQ